MITRPLTALVFCAKQDERHQSSLLLLRPRSIRFLRIPRLKDVVQEAIMGP